MAGARTLSDKAETEIVAALVRLEADSVHLKEELLRLHSPALYRRWCIPGLLAKIAIDGPELDLSRYQTRWAAVSAMPEHSSDKTAAATALRQTLLEIIFQLNKREQSSCSEEVRVESDLAAQVYILQTRVNQLQLENMTLRSDFARQKAQLAIVTTQSTMCGTVDVVTQAQQITDLTRQLTSVRAENESLRQRVGDLTAERGPMLAWLERVETAVADNEESRTALAELEARYEALLQTKAESDAVNAGRGLELVVLRRERDNLLARVAQLEHQLNERGTAHLRAPATVDGSGARPVAPLGSGKDSTLRLASLANTTGTRTKLFGTKSGPAI